MTAAALVGEAASFGISASSLLFNLFVFVLEVLVESVNHRFLDSLLVLAGFPDISGEKVRQLKIGGSSSDFIL